MDEYIDKQNLYNIEKLLDTDVIRKSKTASWLMDQVLHDIKESQAADVAPAVHGIPVLRQRAERYERYEEFGLNENGEMLYLKRIFVDEKSYAMYCPACGKRLCSRFINFCPNCGAKMDGEADHE